MKSKCQTLALLRKELLEVLEVPKGSPGDELKLALSVEGAARALDVSRTLVYQLLKEGALTAKKVGRRTVIPVKELQAFLARCDRDKSE